MRPRFDLFLVSILILFLELACIRWFPAHVLFLSFFTNTVLLACFLGMSVGCLATVYDAGVRRHQEAAEAGRHVRHVQLFPPGLDRPAAGGLLDNTSAKATRWCSHSQPGTRCVRTMCCSASCADGLRRFSSPASYSALFRHAADPERAFGANIAGAMFGGLSEYSSLLLGFQYVVLLAVAFYALSAASAYFSAGCWGRAASV